MRSLALFSTISVAILALAACGGRPSAVSQQGQDSAGAYGSSGGEARNAGASTDPRDAPTPKINGKPLWAANRKHTAEENARYQFGKNGGDFNAKTETDYVTQTHSFVENPPNGVETVDRSNGDRLIYDPKANVFAVVSKDGAPRTMFKPREGATYWTSQKDRESRRAQSGGRSGGGGPDQS